MGKYMKKSKISSGIEASEPTALGVRTRAAKTLALKRLNSSALSADSSCYLQLRSRRLEKPKELPRHHKSGNKESASRFRVDSVNSNTAASDSVVAEVCFGDNSLDFESRHRESTPCNFLEDLNIITTPGSSTRLMRTTTTTSGRDSMVPTTNELEEFFGYADQLQQRLFIEKYNYDIVNDMPLTGRYEWVQVIP